MSPSDLGRRAMRYRWAVVVVIAGLLLAAGTAVWASGEATEAQSASLSTQVAPATLPPNTTTSTLAGSTTTEYAATSTTVAGVTSTATTMYTHPITDPARVIIPAIDVNALIIKV